MNRLLTFLILFAFIAACHERPEKRNVDKIEQSSFYRDYDIFSRKGLDSLDKTNLTLPFVQEYERNDSLITLRIYTKDFESFEYMVIPAHDGYLLKTEFNPLECEGMYFMTIDSGKIIRYNYQSVLYDVLQREEDTISLYDVVPYSIEVITENSIKLILFADYLENEYHYDLHEKGTPQMLKEKMILPFHARIDFNGGFETYGKHLYLTRISETPEAFLGIQYVIKTEDSTATSNFKVEMEVVNQRFYYSKYFQHLRPFLRMI